VSTRKEEIITLKVDGSFVKAMKGIPNRSAFIRSAVLAALKNACPLCGGTGNLTPNQKAHWDSFAAAHDLEECADCHELRIICNSRPVQPVHRKTLST
jgi:hypothetical protein